MHTALKVNRMIWLAIIILIAWAIFTQAEIVGAKSSKSESIIVSSYGCKPYTHGMVLSHTASQMTHSSCQTRTDSNPTNEDETTVVIVSTETAIPTETVPTTNTPVPPAQTPVPPVTNTPSPTETQPPIVTETAGNPGNGKDVGKAGEKCDKSMCENTDGESGEHGKSKND